MSEVAQTQSAPAFDSSQLRTLLKIYYKRLFPYRLFTKWLTYGYTDPDIFTNREISFTLANDIYLRYLSFSDCDEFEKEIQAKLPEKIDIGAVYDVSPKNRLTTSVMTPMQRELVFDIDMTDYDNVRTCCEGASVCEKCWKFMAIACNVIDTTLREDFGFEHLLWVFSGRRGIHCWVCDPTARQLTDSGRGAVAEYMNVLMGTGPEASLARVQIGNKMHHSVKRSFKIIEPFFTKVILEDQKLFDTAEGVKKLLSLITDLEMRKEAEKALKPVLGDSKKIWDTFCRHFEYIRTSSKGTASRKAKFLIEEVQLALLYPRLDINVSKGMKHLLKAPFCIHPKSGKVCVPFRPSKVFDFNPDNVPTLSLLMEEINAFDKENTEQSENVDERRKIQDIKKTSMYKGIKIFEEFLRKLEETWKDNRMEF
ncbi:DNA primase small subunit [Culicoides brevitarsis]|uniref:DNA primase small subunit n=1 Tax=Culicoides brevitarsis TaxID=469753 RepID=UPI00307CB7FD